MGLEILSDSMPDTYGLPEYKVADMRGEIIGGGHDVRLVCGAHRFGNINWLYTAIVSPEDLLVFSEYCKKIACEAFNMYELTRSLRSGGRH